MLPDRRDHLGLRPARRGAPLFLETSRPGIFAVGDVRSGSVKRAAAAIGEGSMAVRLVFDRLQPAGTTDAISSPAPADPALGPKF